MAGAKFYGTTSTLLLSSALISVSVLVIAEESRQCYWCGPLAEQVHRSRRAPPCDAPKAHLTTCDPGYTHCAIVATAPPYTESRYCVKIYQDECYLDFCNSTKTWKMTCPCKGDLCNGQNSDREDEAFTELLAKTQKALKKRTKKSVNEAIVTEDRGVTSNDLNDSSIIINNIENNNLEADKDVVTRINLEKDPLKLLEKEGFLTSTNLVTSHDYPIETETTTMVHADGDAPKHAVGNIGIQSTVEPTIKITNINKIEQPLSGNLVKTNQQLPTAEALQESASSNVDNGNDSQQDTQTTSAEELSITTEGAELSNGNSTSKNTGTSTRVHEVLFNFALLTLSYKAFV